MKLITRTSIFIILNFAALAIGGLFTGEGVVSDWYKSLNQAPWTPPGWVFGVAWSTIMICFSFFMALLYKERNQRKKLTFLYSIQIILNIAWNPVFFHLKNPAFGFIIILLLTFIVFSLFLYSFRRKKHYSLLILPYALWLCVATSLNFYILIYN